jgi:hypothetical protein
MSLNRDLQPEPDFCSCEGLPTPAHHRCLGVHGGRIAAAFLHLVGVRCSGQPLFENQIVGEVVGQSRVLGRFDDQMVGGIGEIDPVTGAGDVADVLDSPPQAVDDAVDDDDPVALGEIEILDPVVVEIAGEPERIRPGAAGELVVAGTAVEGVVAGVARERR